MNSHTTTVLRLLIPAQARFHEQIICSGTRAFLLMSSKYMDRLRAGAVSGVGCENAFFVEALLPLRSKLVALLHGPALAVPLQCLEGSRPAPSD